MEFSVSIPDFEDARDFFLLAKDRLLDINDWGKMLQTNDFQIYLTDNNGHKVHRDAHVDDLVVIKGLIDNSEKWVRISKLQYDFFPDIKSEAIYILLESSYPPSGYDPANTAEKGTETVLIKRDYKTITAHCNGGNELPDVDDMHPDEHVNTSQDIHPVLNMPSIQLQKLLEALLYIPDASN